MNWMFLYALGSKGASLDHSYSCCIWFY